MTTPSSAREWVLLALQNYEGKIQDPLFNSFYNLFHAVHPKDCWDYVGKKKRSFTLKKRSWKDQSSLLCRLNEFYVQYRHKVTTEGLFCPSLNALRKELTQYTCIYEWLLLRVFPFIDVHDETGVGEVETEVTSSVDSLPVEHPIDQKMREIRTFFWFHQLTLLEMYHFLKKYKSTPLKIHGVDDYPSILQQFGLYMYAHDRGLPTVAYPMSDRWLLEDHYKTVLKLMKQDSSESSIISILQQPTIPTRELRGMDDKFTKYILPFERDPYPSTTCNDYYKMLTQ